MCDIIITWLQFQPERPVTLPSEITFDDDDNSGGRGGQGGQGGHGGQGHRHN